MALRQHVLYPLLRRTLGAGDPMSAQTIAERDERKEKLDAAHAELVESIAALVSGEDWQSALDVAARFHRYSPSNCFLILCQRPDATRVAGYRKWQEFGRQVRKGEKAIRIFAPIMVRKTDEDSDEGTKRQLVGFRLAPVFDISQTEGDDLPDIDRPVTLDGDAPGLLWDALAEQVSAAGFTLERGDTEPANGWTNHATKTVRVSDTLDGAQACKTLAHELAHALLHADHGLAFCRGIAEVEAESVAYLVMKMAGVTSDGYSFPYIAGWAKGDTQKVQDTAERVISTARTIINQLAV